MNRYWQHIAGMGGEEGGGVTLRWFVWTNIPLRGEYAAFCKNLVNFPLYGFCQGQHRPRRLKKKGFNPPPPPPPPPNTHKHTHTHTHFTDHKTTGLNIVFCIKSLYVEVLLSLPPSLAAPSPLPAPHRLGNFFAFPIPWLVSDSTQFKLNFTLKVCFFPPYF